MKKIAITIFIHLMILITSAQEQDIQFENISTFSGLSASQAKCIFQDSEGYLWIGTLGGGLNRYDGYSFTVYKHKTDDSTTLINNDVYSLSEDKYGNLWIATAGGISKFIKSEGIFINYDLAKYFDELKDIGYHSVYEVFVDSKDRIWFGTSYHGALLFDEKENSFVPVPQQSGDSVLTLPTVCGDFTEDQNGRILAAGGSYGFFWYDEEKAIFKSAKLENEKWDLLKTQDVFRIYADSENNIWLMTTTDLYKYLPSSQKLKHLLNYTIPNPINDGFEGELVEDSEGNMYAVHLNMQYPVKFQNLSDNPISLNSNRINPTDIFIDSFGIVWISDWSLGLHKYVSTKQIFHSLNDKKTGKILLEGHRIDAICQSLKDPKIIFVKSRYHTWNNIISYNLKNGESRVYNTNDKSIFTMIPNIDGTFWVGLWDQGLAKWTPETNDFKTYFADSSKSPNLANMSVTRFQRDKENHLWIGAWNGLYRMSTDERDLELIIPDYVITSILFDDNILWIGTYGTGFIKYDLLSKEVKNYQHDKYSNSISDNTVWDIFRDNEGFLWLATKNGLNRFDLRTQDFKVFREKDGLENDYVAAILYGGRGNIWLSTNYGITRMQKESQNRISFSNYDATDGLMNPDFQHPVKFKDNLGRMYFGGFNGLYYFTPQERKSLPPITNITDIVVNGKSIFNSTEYNMKSVNEENLSIDLNHEQNTLLIEFIALHFAQPSKNRYSYYLEGYDSDWQFSTKPDVQYINLDPGKYSFHLRSANRDGIWSSEKLTLEINIGEPWWNTWYSYLLYFALFIGGLSGVRQYELNRRKENENKKILEADNRRKSEELEEARKLQLSMLPRQIPQLPSLDIAVYMKTATEVGGDYYDFHIGLDGTLTAVIGDATGHGMRAGTMVTSSKSLFSSYAENDDIINTFHEMTRCIKNMHLDNLAMCLTMIKIQNNRLRMSSAGMPPVYLYRKNTSSVEEYLFQGMPLGSMSNFPYETRETMLSSGDTILLMSDGFPELINNNEEMFGFKRVKHLFEEIALNNPEKIIDNLKISGSKWVNDNEPDDDVTFVVIKVK